MLSSLSGLFNDRKWPLDTLLTNWAQVWANYQITFFEAY